MMSVEDTLYAVICNGSRFKSRKEVSLGTKYLFLSMYHHNQRWK